MIELNINNITDEIFALSALRAYQFPDGEMPSVLSRDQLPALRILIRNAFSRMVADLMPYVSDVATDETNLAAQQPYNSRESIPLKIDFGSYTSFLNSGSLLILRRRLEHLLALQTLASCSSCSPVKESSASAAAWLGAEVEIASLLDSIRAFLTLDSESTPLFVRPYA